MKKLFICIIFFVIITGGCKEKYLPSIASPSAGYLVVEGFINSGPEPTSISLTRTTRLYDPAHIVNEHNAVVNIESEIHETFPLNEIGNGVYVSSPLNLDNHKKYRLQIKTRDGKEYVSDFVTVKNTPAIDSISWKRENDGVKIYIDTHDPQNNTRYYQWKYEETWEIHSAYPSSLQYVVDPLTNKITGVAYKNLQYDTSIYKCWRSTNSVNINLGTSEKLSKDLIYLPLLFIDPASEKISVLYSINVKQYALSHEAYLFFEKIKKNTEQVGSVFDPQPSELRGNIHCITIPGEIVVGYVDILEEKNQRIFISNAMLPGWNYNIYCELKIIDNHPDSISKYGLGFFPTVPSRSTRFTIIDFYASPSTCVDCTLRGTNVKPSFWP